MSDIHALSGAYAVDALDDHERADFEQHLAHCAECRAEVASFRETAALVAETEAVTPPASLRADVLGAIGQVRPLPPETPAGDELAVRRRRLPAILAAAAAVVLLAVGAAFWHPWQDHTVSAADQVLHAPDAVRTVQPLSGGGELTLVRSPSLDRAVMVGTDVPDPAPGRTYQLWLQQNGQMVSAGLMSDPGTPTPMMGDPGTATAAAVSVEPSGGSPSPTTDPVALFTFASGSSGNDGA